MRIDISSFGASPEADCTSAIQKAIDACSSSGGGEVVVPAGRFVTGTLRLKSGVTLLLCEGATLLGSARISQYPEDVHRSMYAGEPHQDRCLIFAQQAKSIAIAGRGTIDGQGGSFPHPTDRHRHRPMLIRFVDCQRLSIRDVRLHAPGSTAAAILYCSDVRLDGVRVEGGEAEDGDGIVLDGCRDVQMHGCDLDVRRDAICLHSSRADRPMANAIISDCMLSGASGIRVGMISVGMIREFAISNCILHDIDDTAIKVQVNEGGVVQNLRFSNLVIRDAAHAIFMSLNRYRAAFTMPTGIPPMGAMCRVSFAGIQMHSPNAGDGRAAIVLVGARDGRIEDVSISDADLLVAGGGQKYEGRLADIRELGAGRPEAKSLGSILPAYGLYARHIDGLHLRDVRFHTDRPDEREAQVLDDVSEF